MMLRVALILAASTLPTFAQADETPTRVRTESGSVAGVQEGALVVFRGIPYAKAPVGDLRWRAPKHVERWKGVRTVDKLSPDCMQGAFGVVPPGGRHPVAEDCLYLNVWRPARAARKLPVMVWIHGGGFVNGGSSSADSTGEGIAARGVLFVSFNYRLGRFGFFGFPALNDEQSAGGRGNYGLMDQIAALQWVRRNIEAFGGDADNVTVVGESAGGISINMLLTSPSTSGLFDRAIIQSGGGRDLVRRRTLTDDLPGALSATTLGSLFARSKGIEGTDAAALSRLRALSAEEITSGLNMVSLLLPERALFSGPVIDGRLFTETPEAAYAAGRQHPMPVIIGTTSSDLSLHTAKSIDEAFAAFGSSAALAKELYDPQKSGELKRINNAIGADRAMVEPARFIARSMVRLRQPVYSYRFSYVLDAKRAASPYGAQHASDVPFAFDRLNAVHGAGVSTGDSAMAAAMSDYWVAFGKAGDPNAGGRTSWPRYGEDEQILEFAADGFVRARADPWRRRLDLVEALQNDR
ncbi:para-nitrobenzyl esterase [Povalibacter uvarum]|uniref:Carboxylic ester hydrolase n=1 Tax=Povalibacter uvarum TaxID=732238 RepID=A0A841HFY7_9GAMM|nr:carboxylesterase family protein [Povalibacter uvarum]MBB6091218.1 para-nitrobenzyl esterase [Povalibacter uvarum]